MKTIKSYTFLICFYIIFSLCSNKSDAQTKNNNIDDYDEFYVILTVENLGYFNINAIYYHDKLYLPIVSMFNKLKIYTAFSPQFDSIWGYIGNEENAYKVNTITKNFIFRDKTLKISESQFIKTFDDLYFPVPIYEYLFGFKIKFDFRSLNVYLHSDVELPVIKLLRQKKIRENLRAINNEIIVDTTINRQYHFANGFVFDWDLSTKQESNIKPEYSLRTDLGMELFGGELNIRTNLNNNLDNIKLNNQTANWLLVRNQSSVLRQVNIGIINVPLYSQVTTGLLACKLTNTPTTFRKSYGTYTIHKETTPGWEVELYINNVLIDFTTADVNGQYNFEIPLIYGNSSIMLKHYGPWGEEKIEEYVIDIPFTFVPNKKLEYQIYSGITYDSLAYKFAHAVFSYGLSRKATISAGYETFERNKSSRNLPFTQISVTPFTNGIFSYSYIVNAFQQLSLLYRLKNNFSIEGDIKFYDDKQDALLTKNKKDADVGINIPFSFNKNKITGYFKNSYKYNQTIIGDVSFYETNLSLVYKRYNLGMVSAMSFKNTKTFTSGINFSAYLPKQWTFFAYSFANVKDKNFTNIRLQIQKRFNKNFYTSFSYNHSFYDNSNLYMLNTYIDLNALRSSFNFARNNKSWQSNQAFSGSLIFSKTANPVSAISRPNVGKGIIDVMVFLDINHNNIKDNNEPLIKNASVNISKGIKILPHNDSIHRFVSLEPYTKYIISVKNAGFNSIAWMLDKQTIAVYPDPNQIKQVYIPVKPMGEIEGKILIEDEDNKQIYAPKIIVIIKNANGTVVHKMLSDNTGYFNYMGLSPGNYTVSLDYDQIANLNYEAIDYALDFQIKESIDGDYINDLTFILKKINNNK